MKWKNVEGEIVTKIETDAVRDREVGNHNWNLQYTYT